MEHGADVASVVRQGECVLCVGGELAGRPPLLDLLRALPFRDVISVGGAGAADKALAVQRLRGLAASSNLLLVGFAWDDPDLELVLARVLDGRDEKRPHFAVLEARGGAARDAGLIARGVHVLAEVDLDAFAERLRASLAVRPAGVSSGWDALPMGGRATALAAPPAPEERIAGLLDQAEAAPLLTRRAELLQAAAAVFEEELADADRALTTLLASYRAGPRSAILGDLERLAEATGRWSELADEMAAAAGSAPDDPVEQPLYLLAARRGERWPELAEALARRAGREPDPRVVARLHAELGDVLESHLDDPERAGGCYVAAIDADPGLEDAWLGLEQLHRRRDDAHGMVRALADASARRHAIARYAARRAHAPDDDFAAAVLERLSADGTRLDPAEEIACRRALLPSAGLDDAAEHLAGIAHLYLEDLEDPAHALAALRAALELRPDDRRLAHRCLELLVEQKQWRSALELLERLILRERDDEARARYALAAARLCRNHLDATDRAARYLEDGLGTVLASYLREA